MISRLKPILSFKDLETVIHAFITSRLDYCNSLYVGICQRHLSHLQTVQNAAARLLTGIKKGIILLQYYLLFTGYQFSTGSILLMVFKALHNMSPSYITNLLEYHTLARTLRSADKLLLAVPRSPKKSKGDTAFMVMAPKLWNSLPLHIRQAPSLEVFKSHLKTHLFTLAFS